MFRSATARPLLNSLVKVSTKRSGYSVTAGPGKLSAVSRSLDRIRPRVKVAVPYRPWTQSILRYATVTSQPSTDAERKILNQRIKSHPEDVSTESSVRHVLEDGVGRSSKDSDGDMLAGIRADIETIKETFALTDVPRESYYIGAAGVLPYLATSLSTVFLAWDINHAQLHGSGYFLSPETAHQLLGIIEPIQIGYGAVIISFLGAIHWGLEYAGYGGYHSYRRYAFGVIAPAIAWPTMLMPIEYALITQFLAFNFLYFADAKATVRGWAPPWYSTYRFVLTFVVGASIVVSLVGRGQIVASDHRLSSTAEKFKVLRDSQWDSLEREEREKRAQAVQADENQDQGE